LEVESGIWEKAVIARMIIVEMGDHNIENRGWRMSETLQQVARTG